MTKHDEFAEALYQLEIASIRHGRENVYTCYGTLRQVENARSVVLAIYATLSAEAERQREEIARLRWRLGGGGEPKA